MSVKIKQTTKQVEEKEYFCDLCDKKLGGKWIRRCRLCGKELCLDCSVEDWRDLGDYPEYYCTKCYEIGKPFIERYKQEEKRNEEAIDAILDEWNAAVKGDNK